MHHEEFDVKTALLELYNLTVKYHEDVSMSLYYFIYKVLQEPATWAVVIAVSIALSQTRAKAESSSVTMVGVTRGGH